MFEGGSDSRILTPLPSGQPAKPEVPVVQDPPRLETCNQVLPLPLGELVYLPDSTFS